MPDRRVAIVTGASQGMGATLVDSLLGQAYAVVATALSIEATDSDGLLTISGDITQPDTATRVVDGAIERFNRIDCLINMAGVHLDKPFTDYTRDDFDAMAGVNLLGFFLVTQRAIRHMVEQGSGHIVNITSSAVEHPQRGSHMSLVTLTKGGLAAVTRSLAIEYAPHGIRINAVAPGVIKDPRYDLSSYEGLVEQHPLGRLGQAQDVIDAILYLERADFVTGEILHVDGGQAAGG